MKFIEWFFLNEGRTPEGLFSFAHIFSVTIVLIILVGLYVFLGIKYKNNQKAINNILKVSALIMIALYIIELAGGYFYIYYKRGLTLLTPEGRKVYLSQFITSMPLFLCDIAIYAIPIIAFTKGKVREVLSDFMGIWGIPMGVIGTYLAGNVFGSCPVFSFDGLLCIFIHIVPCAVTVFLYYNKITTLDKKNIKPALISFFCFSLFVLIYDYIFQSFGANFMFFFSGDGTPFDLFRPYVHLWLYQVIVFVLYMSYMVLFYVVYIAIKKKIHNKK